MSKPCKRCGSTDRYKSGSCRSCKLSNPWRNKEKVAKYQKENPEKVKISQRKYKLKKLYGLTLEKKEEMLVGQDSKCAICQTAITLLGKSSHIDHCHETGTVRGLLCNSCNLGLGYFKDSLNNVKKAFDYLQSHEEENNE